MTITLNSMTHGKRAIAEMGAFREREAARRAHIGDYIGFDAHMYSADKLFESALDHIGTDGAQWDRRAK
jgi:hypothetical protein